jgi:Cft2 family RNA processing exonuclease
LIVDHGVEQMIRADRPEWVPVFTGLSVRQFQELVRIVADRGGEQTGAGPRWGLSLADRMLLTRVYYRTNLTFRQIGSRANTSESVQASVAVVR